MKFCGNCGNELKEGADFCIKCGKYVDKPKALKEKITEQSVINKKALIGFAAPIIVFILGYVLRFIYPVLNQLISSFSLLIFVYFIIDLLLFVCVSFGLVFSIIGLISEIKQKSSKFLAFAIIGVVFNFIMIVTNISDVIRNLSNFINTI